MVLLAILLVVGLAFFLASLYSAHRRDDFHPAATTCTAPFSTIHSAVAKRSMK